MPARWHATCLLASGLACWHRTLLAGLLLPASWPPTPLAGLRPACWHPMCSLALSPYEYRWHRTCWHQTLCWHRTQASSIAGIGPVLNWHQSIRVLLAVNLLPGIGPSAGIGPKPAPRTCAQLPSIDTSKDGIALTKDYKCLIDSDVEHKVLAVEELEPLRWADSAQA